MLFRKTLLTVGLLHKGAPPTSKRDLKDNREPKDHKDSKDDKDQKDPGDNGDQKEPRSMNSPDLDPGLSGFLPR